LTFERAIGSACRKWLRFVNRRSGPDRVDYETTSIRRHLSGQSGLTATFAHASLTLFA
jgi:hypothetical protein